MASIIEEVDASATLESQAVEEINASATSESQAVAPAEAAAEAVINHIISNYMSLL